LPVALVIGVLCIVALCAGLPFYMNADWVPESTRSKLPGSNRDEVRALLGEPDFIDKYDDFERWRYNPFLRLAEFRVEFGRDGLADDGSYDR
jgi:outer membrane protein assembly factor BamE (lipoprotein component of BamABCDE complex)